MRFSIDPSPPVTLSGQDPGGGPPATGLFGRRPACPAARGFPGIASFAPWTPQAAPRGVQLCGPRMQVESVVFTLPQFPHVQRVRMINHIHLPLHLPSGDASPCVAGTPSPVPTGAQTIHSPQPSGPPPRSPLCACVLFPQARVASGFWCPRAAADERKPSALPP